VTVALYSDPFTSGVQLVMLRPLGVVSPPGQAGGKAREKRRVRPGVGAGGAAKGSIPEDMSLRGISDIMSNPSVEDNAVKEGP
jgi:hypothetical protein